MAVRGEGGVEDLCLEMLLHIAPLSQFMYSIPGYFCNCRVGENLKVRLTATPNMCVTVLAACG